MGFTAPHLRRQLSQHMRKGFLETAFAVIYLRRQLQHHLHIYLLETVPASSYPRQSPYSLAITNKQTKVNAASFSPIPLLIQKIYVPLHTLSPDGGIGRRAGLKHQWSNPSRFDPGSGYYKRVKLLVSKHLTLFLFGDYSCFVPNHS